jgi:hypothetical protein
MTFRQFSRTYEEAGMRGKSGWSARVAAVGVALAAFGLAAVGTSAAAAPGALPITCSAGYLCIQSFGGGTTMVPAGQSESFSPSLLMTGITNLTGESYCVAGDPNFNMPNGGTLTRTQTIDNVGPGQVCAAQPG